ncbi:molybdate ABC transporter substrate-binding protein [Paenibacillus sp. CAU 1523]|uniref:Molybdate ABC transporter substrate-binding protein n=2 Tax=Paenibacillus arenosi TaxID=2774142 RepID=A0ABR9ATA8_9BACL|nr:molybdate ABC transporter substrate-binding protein [Paenibacillus arenosi]MBD8497343.1 molybdate ABC transporter substrate-binding protein [Paenibacillus arenosi]
MNRIMKPSMILLLVLLSLVWVAGCTEKATSTASNNTQSQVTEDNSNNIEKVELTISAAASLTDALTEIQKSYEAANTNMKLNFNFGGSGALQQQIEQGAPVDLFLSAAPKNMNALVDKKLIDTNQQRTLLTNELVVVVPSSASITLESLGDLTKENIKKMAIGIPESVPAGNYAKEALTHAQLWESLQAKTVQAKDVRQVLQYVETENVEAGFVYKTDALSSSKVKIAFSVDPNSYTPVQYPIGIVKSSKHSKESEAFYTYLQSKEALDVFVKYGFSISK